MILHHVTVTAGSAREVQITGNLDIQGDLHAYGSVIVCRAGELRGSTGSLQFHVVDDRQFTGNTSPGPLGSDFHPQDVGLWVLGRVAFAASEVTSWVDVEPGAAFSPLSHGIERAKAISGSSALLSRVPTGWLPGDTLVLTTEQGASALATFDGLAGNRLNFTADTEVTGYVLRFNGKLVKPKIGNLSRRFQVVSAEVTESSPNHRAHIAIMGSANFENVEIRNLGPRAKLGRYPIHWHRVANAAGQGISGSSIWSDITDPGNRWLTIHSTQGLKVQDNVMYRAQGHGVFMEAGDEFNNDLTGNLTIAIQHPEELSNVNEQIFRGTSHATNHYWVRQGNTFVNNVAVGHTDEIPFNKFPEANGLAILPSVMETDALVDGFICLACGGFGAWSYVDDELVRVDNSQFVYSRIAGWYPVLNNTEIANSTLLMNGWDSAWSGQIFFNSAESRVLNSDLAGYYGVHNHYSGRSIFYGGSINATYAIDPTYWETVTRVFGTEITASKGLFYRNYPNLKRQSPTPIWFENATLNGAPLTGMFVRHQEHSRYFDSLGAAVNSGIEVQPEPGFWLPHRDIDGVYQHRYFRSVTPLGEVERLSSFASENEQGYWSSVARGDLGYPHGFPAGQYLVRYYATRGAPLLYEETVTLGGVSPGQQAPVAEIESSTTLLPDTDGLAGETVTLQATAFDRDGTLMSIEWSVNGEVKGSGNSASLFLDDGAQLIVLRVIDDDGNESVDSMRITVEPPQNKPPAVLVVKSDSSPTGATIRMGATADNRQSYRSDFTTGESVQLFVTIEPEEKDLGATSFLYVLVTSTDGENFYMVTPTGLERWDGSVEHLAAIDEIVLARTNWINVLAHFRDEPELLLNEIGQYSFLVGYTSAGGEITYMNDAFVLTVSAGSSTL